MENGTLTWRALTPGDAPALSRAFAAVETDDRTGEHDSEHDLRDELADASIDLARDTLAALAPDGTWSRSAGCTARSRSTISTGSTPWARWCRPPAAAASAAGC